MNKWYPDNATWCGRADVVLTLCSVADSEGQYGLQLNQSKRQASVFKEQQMNVTL